MFTSPTLNWLLAIALALLLAYLIWRWLAMHRPAPSVAVEPTPPAPASNETGPMPPRRPSPDVAPPPAMAGPYPGGVAQPSKRTPAGSAIAPPPASAGGGPARRASGAAPGNRVPSVPPPPAAAGGAQAGTPPAPSRPVVRETAPPPVRETVAREPAAAGGGHDAARALAAATSWGYQLQNLDIGRAAAAPFDVLVIDYAKDGSDDTALGPRDLARMRQKADGGRRLLLAYLSIGEAESYRSYWDAAWATSPPAWLLSENPDWKENFAVCFWETDWQRVLCGAPDAYLDKIIAAGFDGIYLDKCDVFQDIARREKKVARLRPDLEGDMVRLVVHLSRYAKAKRPGFAVVMQNAEELLEHAELRAAIDGVAKEELVFGQSGGERRNARQDTADARRALDLAKAAGKPVFVVEYLADEAKVREAAAYAAEAGYVLYVAPKDRELDRLNYVVLEA